MAYATPDNLALAFDVRDIADLASDTGTPVADINCTVVTFALERASGDVDAAALSGKLYAQTDLEQLTGNSRSMLIGIVCDRAMAYLMRRRPEKFNDEAINAVFDRTDKFLDALRNGERVFDVDAAMSAGLPTVDGPTWPDYVRMNLLPDRTQNFYPNRGSRLPIGRGYGG